MTNPRAKGARLERIAKRALEARGYVVIRAAGSHGPFDLVALRDEESNGDCTRYATYRGYEVLCVQVKANRKPSGNEIQAMSRVAVPSEAWVHRDWARVWDVYEATSSSLKLVRREPYNPSRPKSTTKSTGLTTRTPGAR